MTEKTKPGRTALFIDEIVFDYLKSQKININYKQKYNVLIIVLKRGIIHQCYAQYILTSYALNCVSKVKNKNSFKKKVTTKARRLKRRKNCILSVLVAIIKINKT